MLIEYSEFLTLGLRPLGKALCRFGLSEASVSAAFSELSPVAVKKCSNKYGAELTSDVAFKLSHMISPKLNSGLDSIEPLLPERIAQMILAELSSNIFKVEVGGAGYLNAEPSTLFKSRFFERISSVTEGSLGQRSLLFSKTAFVVGDCESREDFKWDLAETSLKKLRAYLRSHADEKSFFTERNPSGTLSKNDSLMLLGLAGDAELDLRPYQLELNGRENLPWYFSRFELDAMNAKQSLINDNDFHDAFTDKALNLPTCMKEALEALLSFRSMLIIGQRDSIVLLNYTLKLIRSFYAYYHHPLFRALLSAPPSDASRQQAAAITYVLSDCVQSCLAAVESSCQLSDFVLEV